MKGIGALSLVTCRTLHFVGLKLIPHSFSDCSSTIRSSCKMFASDRELIHKYMAVSSTKGMTLDLTFSSRSFLYPKKRIGPRACNLHT